MAQINNLSDEKTFESLCDVSERLSKLSFDILYEGAVCRAELNHRVSLGLTGQAALDHFNDWMVEFGLSYLCV